MTRTADTTLANILSRLHADAMELRRSLCQPIPAIFEVAGSLLDAVSLHLAGDVAKASKLLAQADREEIRHYTNQAWGKGSGRRNQFVQVPNSPPYLSEDAQPKPRMPNMSTKKALLTRDGFHCRFCGMPVIDGALRILFAKIYHTSVRWGRTNDTQHAAFQCMWLQFDHILPSSRGGTSSLENMVIACAPCNYSRMNRTIEEARLIHPLSVDPPIAWDRHAEWDGLETFRSER